MPSHLSRHQLQLAALVIQNAGLAVLMHSHTSNMYSSSSAAGIIVIAEGAKGIISLAMSWKKRASGSEDVLRHGSLSTSNVIARLFIDWDKMVVPAALYLIQNNLQYVAARNLDLPTFQIVYSLKMFTATFFSFFALGKRLSTRILLGGLLLLVGVAIAMSEEDPRGGMSGIESESNRRLGLFAAVCGSSFSGVAVAYTERVLKPLQTDKWTQNTQLAAISFLPALGIFFLPRYIDAGAIHLSPFCGLDRLAYLAIALHVCGGLQVANIVQGNNSALKALTTPLSLALTTFVGFFAISLGLTPPFLVATITTMAAACMYATSSRRSSFSLEALTQDQVDSFDLPVLSNVTALTPPPTPPLPSLPSRVTPYDANSLPSTPPESPPSASPPRMPSRKLRMTDVDLFSMSSRSFSHRRGVGEPGTPDASISLPSGRFTDQFEFDMPRIAEGLQWVPLGTNDRTAKDSDEVLDMV